MREMGTVKSTTDEVALLLHQVSLPAARRDYELRSSSPAPRAATSSSPLVSRAFQNARAMSFNATAHCKDVPLVLHNQRVFFSGPLSSHGMAHPVVAVRAPAGARDLPSVVVDRDSSAAHAHGRHRIDRALSASPVVDDASCRSIRPAPRRAFSGDLRAPKSSTSFNNHNNSSNRPRSSELARELMRASSSTWSREDSQLRNADATRACETSISCNPTRACDVTGACEVARAGDVAGACEVARAGEEEPKKRGESRRRPTASIAWDSLNESQANSPQHELAAIPFQWEEAPGKPLAMRVREDSQQATARLATPMSRPEAGLATTPLLRAEEVAEVRAHSHRFYARSASQCELPARKSSFDAASAHLISEVVSSIDLVAPAAAKFLVENWVSPALAPEAHVAVPFQWEEAPGVPLKLDPEEEGVSTSAKPVVPLQLPPRLASPAPPALSKEEMRGRMRTRSMSGPLAGYYPHASPARRRQLQHSPVAQRRSCSPSKRSISPSRIHAIAHHFSSSHRKREGSGHDALTASLEAELRDTAGSGAGLGRSASGALLSEFGRSPRRYNLSPRLSPTQRSVSPSRRIHALAKQLTCKIRPASGKPQNAIFVKSSHGDPWSPTSPVNILQDELHLSGPSSSNSDMDASSQTPVSEGAFSKSFSRVSYESFEHSFARRAAAAATHSPSRNEVSPPDSPYLGPTGDDFQESRKGSPLGAAELGVKAMVKLCRSGSSALRKKSTPQTSAHDLWAPTLASYFRCLEAATLISNPATRAPAAITSNTEQEGTIINATEATVQTRLPYTMPNSSSAEQNLLWKDYCESPNAAEFRTTCLGVKLSPANLFISRGKKYNSSMESSIPLRSSSSPNTSAEDGYRSPAYAATLELLSPSAELFRKKKRVVLGSTSRGIKLVMPSTRRRTQIMEAVCTSLKRALYKCAKRCCRKACSPPPLSSAPSR